MHAKFTDYASKIIDLLGSEWNKKYILWVKEIAVIHTAAYTTESTH